MKLSQTHRTLFLALSLTATACSGGGGSAGGAGANHSTAVGALTRSGQVAVVDARTAAVTPCTDLGVAGYAGTIALALDSARDRFYTHDFGREVLLRVESGGSVRQVAQAGVLPDTLTFDRGRGLLFGTRIANSTRGELSSIDPATGEATVIGLSAKVRALAFDPTTDVLLGLEGVGSEGVLYAIDPDTGIATELFRAPALATVHGLAFDAATRTLFGIRPSAGSLLDIDLNTQAITEVALFTSASDINDIAFDQDSGRLFGLTQGGELVELTGTWPAGTLERRAVLSRRLGSLTLDPLTGETYAVDVLNNELVRLDASARTFTAIGSLGTDRIESLVYDPALGTLYGISVIDGGVDLLVELDRDDASRTPVPSVEFLYSTQLAIDQTTGTIYGYERERNLTLLVQPRAFSPDDRVTIFRSQQLRTTGGVSYLFEDLAWNDARGALIGVGTQRVDEGGGSTSFYDVVVSFTPTQQLSDRVIWLDVLDATAIAAGTESGAFRVAQRDQPLVELRDLRGVSSLRSIGGLWDRPFVSAVDAEARGTVFAVDGSFVYAVDPETGETTWVGGQPVGVRADDLLYDAARDLLGLRDGSNLYWVSPDSPSNVVENLTVPPYRLLVGDPADATTAYGLSSGFLYRIDLGTGATTQLNATALAGVQEDCGAFLPGTATISVATEDGRLFEVDTLTGTWAEAGTLRLGVRALFAN